MSGDSRSSERSPFATGVSLALLCAIWGSTWLVIKDSLADVPPITSAAARMALAAATMLALAPAIQRREGGTRPPLWLSLVVGSTQLGYSYAIVYLCETKLPSGLSSLVWSAFPMMMAISAHFFLEGERLVRAQWLGFVVGSAGIVVLFAKVLDGIGSEAVPAGALLLTSPLAACLSNTLVKRHASRASSALLNRDALCVAALGLSAAAWIFERDATSHWTLRAIGSVVYLGLVATALAFGLYFWLMRSISAHRMSLISYANPVIALILGWWIGAEEVTEYTLIGSALILAGIVLVVRGRAIAERLVRVPAAERIDR